MVRTAPLAVAAAVVALGAASWFALPDAGAAIFGEAAPAAGRASPVVLAQADGPVSPAPRGEVSPRLDETVPAELAGVFTDEQKAAIAALVREYVRQNPDFIREYLLANPEVIRDAVAELERKRQEQEASQQQLAIDANRDLIFNSPRQVVLGNPKGDVTLVEFFDYNCTYCKRSLADMDRLVQEDPNLRVVLKEFPVLGPGSVEAAEVAVGVLAVAPEKYEAFHEELLGGRAPASADRALAVAEDVGIDVAAVKLAMLKPDVNATIEEVYTLANALGLTGTPTYVIGDEVVVGAVGYDALKAKIDSMRACGAASC